MKHNMGKIERVIRLVLGVVLFMIGWRSLDAFGVFAGMVTSSAILGLILAVIGVVAFITGVLAYCPVNTLLHVNSCEACKIGETHSHLPV
jgi:hypothetical protein